MRLTSFSELLPGSGRCRNRCSKAKDTVLIATAEDDVFETALPNSYIGDTLSIYQPEHIYLTSAAVSGEGISGTFLLKPYPFVRAGHIDYVTASTMMLFCAQLGYVFLRYVINTHNLGVGDSDFLEARDRGDVLLTNFRRLRFRSKIPVSAQTLNLNLKLVRIGSTERMVAGDAVLHAEGRSVEGELRMAMLRSQPLHPKF